MISTATIKTHLGAGCGTCEACPLCQVSDQDQRVFDLLPPLVNYPGSVTLFEAGEYPTGIYLICRGSVKLWCSEEDSRRFLWRLADTGEMLGAVALSARMPHLTVAETHQSCSVRFLPETLFYQLLKQYPAIKDHLIKQMDKMLYSTLQQLQEFVFSQSALDRLGLLLFRLSAEGQVSSSERIPIRIWLSRKEMAERIGVVPETVSRLLGKLAKEGIIKREHGCTVVLEPNRLKNFR